MALPSITIDQFTGEIQLSNEQYATVEFDAFVAEKYPLILRHWLSDAAYVEVRDNDPLRGVWNDIMNGTEYRDSCQRLRIMEGMTKVARYFIYSEWLSYMANPNSATGTVSNFNENSTDQTGNSRVFSATRYNKALSMVHNVYEFIADYQRVTEVATGSTLTAGTFYDVFVPSTLYLFAGMEVVIDGVSYDVVSVNENVSFSIDGGAVGLDFTGDTCYWEPFKGYDVEFKELLGQW